MNALMSFLSQNEDTKQAVQQLITMYPNTEEVTPDTVYKQGSNKARRLIDFMAKRIILPGSKIINSQYLQQLHQLSQQGKSCLILAEHYSNMDMTNLCHLAEQDALLGERFVEDLIAIAGIKLSSDNALVSAFVRAYNRIVIYPSRALESLTDENEKEKMRKMIMPLNMASMKELTTRKYNKQMVIVFPSGTRIRPWDPDTKRGVKEMASYVKAFEYLCFININGNNLPVDQDDKDMTEDKPTPDLIWIEAHPLVNSADFLAECDKTLREGEDKKSHTVQCIMDKLIGYHDALEPQRLEALTTPEAGVL